MPIPINRVELRRLVSQGAQLVEVLPEEEYLDEHLPSAVHLPLKQLNAETAAKLDKTRAVIVYCWDALCDMSPRAAWHLERLGFAPVYDYTPGKVDWIAAGLETEGRGPASPRVMTQTDRNVPTCDQSELVADVVKRIRGSRWDMALAVNELGIVLGRIRPSRVDQAAGGVRVDEVMEPGPATVHADADLKQTLDRLAARNVNSIVVSTPDGELLGALKRDA